MPPKVYVGPPQALPPLKPNVTIRCRGQSGKWCYGDVTDVESRTVQWQDGFTGFPQEGEKVHVGTASKFERLTGSAFRNALKSCYVYDGEEWTQFGKFIGHETKGERMVRQQKEKDWMMKGSKRSAPSKAGSSNPNKRRRAAAAGVSAAAYADDDSSESSDEESDDYSSSSGDEGNAPGTKRAMGSFLAHRASGDADAKAARRAVNALAEAARRVEEGPDLPPPPPKAPAQVVSCVSTWIDALTALGLIKPDSSVDSEKLQAAMALPRRVAELEGVLSKRLGLLDTESKAVDQSRLAALQRAGATIGDTIPWPAHVARQRSVSLPTGWPESLCFLGQAGGCIRAGEQDALGASAGYFPTRPELEACYAHARAYPSDKVRLAFDASEASAVASRTIERGELVAEVVGQARDKYPVDARLDDGRLFRTGDKGLVIDTRFAGNESRYVRRLVEVGKTRARSGQVGKSEKPEGDADTQAGESKAEAEVSDPEYTAANLSLAVEFDDAAKDGEEGCARLVMRARRTILDGERLVAAPLDGVPHPLPPPKPDTPPLETAEEGEKKKSEETATDDSTEDEDTSTEAANAAA